MNPWAFCNTATFFLPHSHLISLSLSLSLTQEQQKQVEDPSREVKKVRKARNRRQEWNVMAVDKEFRPDARFTPSPYHGMSSEGSLSPDNRLVVSFTLTLFQGNTWASKWAAVQHSSLLPSVDTLSCQHLFEFIETPEHSAANLKHYICMQFFFYTVKLNN